MTREKNSNWILWKGSMCDRGNVVWLKGNFYDITKSEQVVGEKSLATWLESGLVEFVDGPAGNVPHGPDTSEEAETVEEEIEPVIAESEDRIKTEKFGDEIPSPPMATSFPKDSEEFVCPYGCRSYTKWNHFINHMRKEHEEHWIIKDNEVIKQG